jgi:hypothetical protein
MEHGKRVGDPMAQSRGLALLWMLDWLRGDWEGAGRELEEALAIKERVEFFTTLLLEGWRCWFSLTKGELDEADRYANMALASQDPKITHVIIRNLPAALLRLEEGKEEEAIARLETCVEAFSRSEFTTLPLHHVETLMHLTVLNAKHNQLDKANSNLEWAKRLATQLKSDAGLAMALQAEAVVLLAGDDKNGAEEAYLKSLALWQKAGWTYYYAKALVAYSEALAQTNPEESKKRLLEAAGVFKKLGARRDLQRAESILQS